MQRKNLPRGIAITVNREGIVDGVLHDTYDLYSGTGEQAVAFTDCLVSDSMAKGYQLLEQINTKGAAYGWELHVQTNDNSTLFNFSGASLKDENLLIGTPNPDDTEKFLNGLMEMNNEQVNKIRAFMKQGAPEKTARDKKEADTITFDDMSGLNNELANMQRKLTKKTAELERINALKDQMLGMAAHDLRNPLTLILNYAAFLLEADEQDTIFDDEQLQLVQEIKESSEYMVQIIEDMLDISAIESGSITLEKEDVNVHKLIKQTVSLNRPSAHKKDISIVLELPDKPVTKFVDLHKFQQVLDNLISNAIKYSESGTQVTVGLKTQDDESVDIYVTDEGQGIPEEELDELFIPFAKISSKPTAGEKSTGLGLAIAYKIVKAHQGKVFVESEVGSGSTFTVHLP